jgi:hypothetical protein
VRALGLVSSVMGWLEDRLRQWLVRRQHARYDAAQRDHDFRPRLIWEGGATGDYVEDPEHCGHVLADDGYSQIDYCNQSPAWHRRKKATRL